MEVTEFVTVLFNPFHDSSFYEMELLLQTFNGEKPQTVNFWVSKNMKRYFIWLTLLYIRRIWPKLVSGQHISFLTLKISILMLILKVIEPEEK